MVTGIPHEEFPQRRTSLDSRQTVSRLDPENLFTKRQHENCKSVRKGGEKAPDATHFSVKAVTAADFCSAKRVIVKKGQIAPPSRQWLPTERSHFLP